MSATEAGWIKLHRCLLEKPIWAQSQPEQKVVLITLLMMANHREKEWLWSGEKFKAEPGQFVTSLQGLSEKSGVSIRSVRTALANFEKLEFLTNKPTKTGRLITIVNWHIYQGWDEETDKESDKEPTKHRQRTDKEPTTNNNDNNDNNDKKKDLLYSPDFESFWKEYPNKKDKGKAFKCWQTRLKERYSPIDMIQAAKNYAIEKKGCEVKFIKHGATFLGPDKPFEEYINSSQLSMFEIDPGRERAKLLEESL